MGFDILLFGAHSVPTFMETVQSYGVLLHGMDPEQRDPIEKKENDE